MAFIFVSGSFTWFRRPRLASLTSTSNVETNHPLAPSSQLRLEGNYTALIGEIVSRIFQRFEYFGQSRGWRRVRRWLDGGRAACVPWPGQSQSWRARL